MEKLRVASKKAPTESDPGRGGSRVRVEARR
jgi:hypothetical protein